MALLSSLWVAGCSVFGIQEVQEPSYRLLARVNSIEIRHYGPRVVAETTVQGGPLRARDLGFRRIAGYIFGANHARSKIAMTAPVAQTAYARSQADGQKIAMTAPVAQTRAGTGEWTIRFFMPAGRTLATLPKPNDASVTLVEVPAETYAVLRFSGTPTPAAVVREDDRLLRGLRGSAWSAAGQPVAWFYNPPWTLPPLRRNEVAVTAVRSPT